MIVEVNINSDTIESATIRFKSTNTGNLSNRICFLAVNQVNQITCSYKLCTPREPIILYYNFCMDSVLFSAVQLWINCTAFSKSNLRNFTQHVIICGNCLLPVLPESLWPQVFDHKHFVKGKMENHISDSLFHNELYRMTFCL